MHPRYIRYRRWQENDRAHKRGLVSTAVFTLRQRLIAEGYYDEIPLVDQCPTPTRPISLKPSGCN